MLGLHWIHHALGAFYYALTWSFLLACAVCWWSYFNDGTRSDDDGS